MMLGAWVVVVTALVLILPGAFVGRRMNLPWPVALAAGPPITFGLVGILTAPLLHGSPEHLISNAIALESTSW